MNRISIYLPQQTASDLQTLLEPVGDYIAAIGTFDDQKVAVIAALAILIQNLQQINGTADDYLKTFSENYIG